MTRPAPVVPTLAAVLLGAMLTTRAASATPLCDPDGHVCIQIDTTSAIVCTPLRPGGWTPASCNASDGDLRKVVKRVDEATHGAVHAVDALIARFDELAVTVMLFRRAAEPEATGDAGAREAMAAWRQILAGARPAGWLTEEVQPPTLSRINGVEVARLETRLSSAGIGGAFALRNIAYEVRARDAAYLVTFDAPDANAAQLTSAADGAMATLDALPAKRAGGAGDGLVWLLRVVVAAAVLVGIGWLVGRLRGRRRAFDSQDLWPR